MKSTTYKLWPWKHDRKILLFPKRSAEMIEGGGLAFEDAPLKDKENSNKVISSEAEHLGEENLAIYA